MHAEKKVSEQSETSLPKGKRSIGELSSASQRPTVYVGDASIGLPTKTCFEHFHYMSFACTTPAKEDLMISIIQLRQKTHIDISTDQLVQILLPL